MHVQVNAVKYEPERLSISPGINCFQKNLAPMDLNSLRDSISDFMEQRFAAGNVGLLFFFFGFFLSALCCQRQHLCRTLVTFDTMLKAGGAATALMLLLLLPLLCCCHLCHSLGKFCPPTPHITTLQINRSAWFLYPGIDKVLLLLLGQLSQIKH